MKAPIMTTTRAYGNLGYIGFHKSIRKAAKATIIQFADLYVNGVGTFKSDPAYLIKVNPAPTSAEISGSALLCL